MKLTLESINNINLFENLTGAKVKDCLIDEEGLLFLVEEGNVKRALGPNNAHLHRISSILKKNIKIIAFSSDVCKFVANLIYPQKIDGIFLENKVVKIVVEDTATKGKIFGRSRENLKRINSLVKNYFTDIEEVVLV